MQMNFRVRHLSMNRERQLNFGTPALASGEFRH
jgi:hypothetical protein